MSMKPHGTVTIKYAGQHKVVPLYATDKHGEATVRMSDLMEFGLPYGENGLLGLYPDGTIDNETTWENIMLLEGMMVVTKDTLDFLRVMTASDAAKLRLGVPK